MTISTNSVQDESPNEVMRSRLEVIGDALAPFYSRAYDCTSLEEFNSICEELNTASYVFQKDASEVSFLIRKTIDTCGELVSLEEKKTRLIGGLFETKEWVYSHKQLFGSSKASEDNTIVAGKFRYSSGIYSYDGKKLNTSPLLARLLGEFLSAPGYRLTKDRISSLGATNVRGGAKHRVSELRKVLRKACPNQSFITYDGYLESYTLHVG